MSPLTTTQVTPAASIYHRVIRLTQVSMGSALCAEPSLKRQWLAVSGLGFCEDNGGCTPSRGVAGARASGRV